MRHLHLIGHGAIGSLLHGYATLNKLSVSTTVRNDNSAVKCIQTLDEINVKLNAPVTRDFILPDDSIIVLPLKAYHIEPALKSLSSTLTPEHTLILLHNGIVDSNSLQTYTQSCTVFSATTSHAARKIQDRVFITGRGRTAFGVANSSKNAREFFQEIESVKSVLDLLIPPVSFEQNIHSVLWKKLAINAVINPLTAIHNVKNGVLANDAYSQTITDSINEIVSVANATGMHFTTQQVSEWVYTVIEQTAQNYSSMHQDIVCKRRTEIDFINGHIVDIANKKGIDVSANATMVEQVKKLSSVAD